ncbi:MAG: hypothetical protein ABI633_06925 [Burkholderiales bacterium]
MNHCYKLKASLLLTGLLFLPLAQAANTTKADYDAGKTRIAADYKLDHSACESLAGNAKDICAEQAKGKQKVAMAELEYGHSETAGNRNKVLVAKADANYAVAKERCDDVAGNVKDVCVKQAKATHVSALADAKMGKQITEARTDAADEKRDADYKVELEKCDATAGEAKSQCVDAAKAKFGKS